MTRRWLAVAVVLCSGSAFGGPLRLAPPEQSEAVTITGERSHLDVTLENTSARELQSLSLELTLPDGWAAEPLRVQIQALAPFTEQRVRFELAPTLPGQGTGRLVVACPGSEPLAAWFHLVSCPPLAQRMAWERATRPAVDALPEDGCLYVATGAYILFLPRMTDGYGAGLIYQRRGAAWVRMATLPTLGRVLYEDLDESGKHSRVAEHWVFGQRVWAPLQPTRMDPDGWYLCTLRDSWKDRRGRTWIAKAYFAPTADPRIIKCTHSLWCSGKVQLYRYEGPALCVGDGTFGTQRRGITAPVAGGDGPAVFSRGEAASEGLMAVEAPDQGVVGLLWNPRQLWTAGKNQPHAVVASPNALDHQANHLLELVVPHFSPGQPAGAQRAARPFELARGRAVFVRSELFVTADGDLAEAHRAWQERFARAGG